MTRYNYDQCYLYFNIGVADTDLQPLVKAASVHYCILFLVDELFLERHDKTRYTAHFALENGTKLEIHAYSMDELDEQLQKMVTPVWLLKQVYDETVERLRRDVLSKMRP
jgi:hypothetical protein